MLRRRNPGPRCRSLMLNKASNEPKECNPKVVRRRPAALPSHSSAAGHSISGCRAGSVLASEPGLHSGPHCSCAAVYKVCAGRELHVGDAGIGGIHKHAAEIAAADDARVDGDAPRPHASSSFLFLPRFHFCPAGALRRRDPRSRCRRKLAPWSASPPRPAAIAPAANVIQRRDCIIQAFNFAG